MGCSTISMSHLMLFDICKMLISKFYLEEHTVVLLLKSPWLPSPSVYNSRTHCNCSSHQEREQFTKRTWGLIWQCWGAVWSNRMSRVCLCFWRWIQRSCTAKTLGWGQNCKQKEQKNTWKVSARWHVCQRTVSPFTSQDVFAHVSVL